MRYKNGIIINNKEYSIKNIAIECNYNLIQMSRRTGPFTLYK